MPPRTLRRAVSVGLATALLTATVASPAHARPEDRPVTAAATAAVFPIADDLARQLAVSLADPATRRALVAATATGPADLLGVRFPAAGPAGLRDANQRILAAKGLPAATGSVLRVRLAHPDMRAALARGVAPVVAATPTDDAPTTVTGYDRTGATVRFDPARVPTRPVLLVEVDTRRALTAGLTLMRSELARRGITDSATAARNAVTATAGYWATKINAVRLNDDMEPWIKGDAEIYSLVAGFGPDGKATVDLVQMPYLNNDGTSYYPNQLLVHFNGYKYNLADVVMMEDDGDTNYQALVQAIVGALLVIVDGGVYQPLVSAILDAIPSSWYTDDPDYVDSWYTLSTASSGRLNGAAGNGWLDVSPYFVQPL
ncbi:DUF3103 family protein [Micromonospora cathayae]|uniref:DUF3103 family protein n=1 Tax=Micromonospora cathayae TaxID=3028804 RepID=A0ABY7ZLH9_9ACTN|nr:DUF3103 family protein [Micromonospora sp. HUAS 3]WDZ82764.1 DUF3103 family protein [Micromonospora sp. HUAS 3]